MTNQLFQEAEPMSKYNLQGFLENKNLFFGISTRDSDVSKWVELKSKYSVG